LLDFQAADEDPTVDNIVIDVSSPGGVIDGIHEAANLIRASETNVVGYVGATAASAAYFLLAAADEIVIDATARLGSIGVVAGIRPKQEGGPIEFTNTASPNKRRDMETKEGQAQLIAELDALADVFIGSVAAMRDVSVQTVKNDFGQGGMLVGQAAVDIGMADRLGSYEELLQSLTNSNPKTGGKDMDYAALTKETLMAHRKDLVTALCADAVADTTAAHATELSGVTEQVAALTEQNEALTAENKTLKEESSVNEDRIAKLEKKDAVREEQALEATASGIVSARVASSSVPARLHPKVEAGIKKDQFITEGKLDVEGFTAHVDAEVSDWEESIGANAGPVLGIGGTNRGDGEDVDATEDDSIVDRMLQK